MGTPEFVAGWSEVCVGGSGSYQLVSKVLTSACAVSYVCARGREFDITAGS